MSDDGQFGLSIIAFVGSVFSPYYAWANRKVGADPENFCALNVALYSRHQKRWCMTERGRKYTSRDATQFVIGPSQLEWDGTSLIINVKEICAPIPHRITGRIRIEPLQLFNFSTPLDAKGKHHWGPLAPTARIEVDLAEPGQKWSGLAYVDSNEGVEPIENAFHEWDWSRCLMRDGSTAVLYDMEYKDRSRSLLSLLFRPEGTIEPFEAPSRKVLPLTGWRVSRGIRSSSSVDIQDQLEDTPFYQRAMLHSELLGERVTSFHESLSIPRLVSPVVRAMLPWRMPRRS